MDVHPVSSYIVENALEAKHAIPAALICMLRGIVANNVDCAPNSNQFTPCTLCVIVDLSADLSSAEGL